MVVAVPHGGCPSRPHPPVAILTPKAQDSAARRVVMFPPAIQVRRPVVHQLPPALEQVGARVGRLDLVADNMRQGGFDDLAPMVGFLGCPVPERGPEAVGYGGNPEPLQ